MILKATVLQTAHRNISLEDFPHDRPMDGFTPSTETLHVGPCTWRLPPVEGDGFFYPGGCLLRDRPATAEKARASSDKRFLLRHPDRDSCEFIRRRHVVTIRRGQPELTRSLLNHRYLSTIMVTFYLRPAKMARSLGAAPSKLSFGDSTALLAPSVFIGQGLAWNVRL